MFNFNEIDLNQIEEMQTRVGEFIDYLNTFLPKLKTFEKIWIEKHKLTKDHIIIYSALPTNDKIFFYAFAVKLENEKSEITNELLRIELTELAKEFERDGIKVIMDRFVDFMI